MKSTVKLALAGMTMAAIGMPGVAWAQERAPAPAQQQAEDSTPARAPFQSQPLAEGPWDIATEKVGLHVEVVTRGLERPWGMAFLPDGGMLVTERVGRLRLIRDGVLDPTPISGLPPIFAFGIAGLTSVLLDPDFENNRLIYLSYSKADPAAGPNPTVQANSTLAVLRARWDGGAELSDVQDIFVADSWYGAPPLAEKCCGQGPAFGSYGARMVFGQDGHLYVTSGDRNFGEKVQDPANHFGKILRLDTNGAAPADNPFAGQEGWKPEIWSTGHRNPTGLTVDPATGTLWSTEFGPRGGDELNRIERGGNYGWMDVTQGNHYDGTPAKGIKGVAGMIDPVIAWGPPSHNPGNLDFYDGDLFTDWQGDLLIAMMNRSLVRVELDEEGNATHQEAMLGDLGQRLRDVRVGPDGAVYVLTDENEGALLRITPAD